MVLDAIINEVSAVVNNNAILESCQTTTSEPYYV